VKRSEAYYRIHKSLSRITVASCEKMSFDDIFGDQKDVKALGDGADLLNLNWGNVRRAQSSHKASLAGAPQTFSPLPDDKRL
jgi:hypothetical protein